MVQLGTLRAAYFVMRCWISRIRSSAAVTRSLKLCTRISFTFMRVSEPVACCEKRGADWFDPLHTFEQAFL